MGKVREEMGDNNQALTDYQHSLGINPSQPDVTAGGITASIASSPASGLATPA